MILVAGGTGTLGTLLVRRLLDRGLSVRLLTRDAERVADHRRDTLEVVEGDVRDRAAVARAMKGVETVVSAVHGLVGTGGASPASVDRDGNANLIDAAAGGSASVVLVSVVGASPDSPLELSRMKYAAEEHLRRSGTAWTIVRAPAYLETCIRLFEQTAARSGRPLVFGRGDNPINFVSADDVAALVEHAVIDPSGRGGMLEIGGSECLTLNQLAEAVQTAAGRAGGPRHVPRPMLRVMAVGMKPFKPEMARLAQMALMMDTADMTAGANPIQAADPQRPPRSLSEVLASQVTTLSTTQPLS
ncbi:MAG: SDR family NAD(P)-dependent oxidoreductase [Candidatus Dormibacteraeota bacterium]|uniref:SDR family NAD(P)-dependent oxidoreductase n=1 Tax=Candidatus Dormiibacter inghamiae TaxID=3127013 RepID=A0A934KB26_9BACT|nr:SDR family NAD(P)-dependent oxidoreductase [Candidatus Dormibacteraeota bacterium]MBJ7606261.1 SDR family NAD(P)-dependent oxidoreductase [Candidatus Dormibacteraeota bacterium]